MRKPQLSKLLRDVRFQAIASLGLVLGAAATGTYAYWSDSAAVAGSTITSGSIDLKVNGTAGNRLDNDNAYTQLSFSNIVPGQSTAGVITVRNNGLSPLTYYAHGAASNADGKGLGAALVVKVTGAATRTASGSSFTCGGATLANTGTSFSNNLVSSTNPRQLAAGTEETLCIEATLPTGAATSLQNASTNVSFAFTASQIIP
ncbi:putative ribosomally synthesized peptide with SipW-like signal peptide [Marmoricola sp. OAE513]|uniref:SipW-dependent-type signal peptide-containing protein n=1 Tax=Marmoricola sp. OAE513 TaxID=2817894 RepID=UPI001AE53D94